jgi:hypothetical protein
VTQENATVREWTDLLARIRFGTVKAAGKTVRGATIKAVGYRAANYADSDGSRVRPGLPRLAVDLEIDHGTAKRAMQILLRTGLLRLVKAGARPGHADEYQLAIPNDLIDRTDVVVWSPAKQRLEIERVREQTRGRYVRKGPLDPEPETCGSQQHPQTNGVQVPEGPADTSDSARPAGPVGTDIPRPAGPVGTDLQVPEAPATHHGPRHNYDHPTDEEIRTALTGPRAPEAQQPDSDVVDESTPAGEPLPERCPHNLPARRRPDGKPTCALCRVGAPATVTQPRDPDDDPDADHARQRVADNRRLATVTHLRPRSA